MFSTLPNTLGTNMQLNELPKLPEPESKVSFVIDAILSKQVHFIGGSYVSVEGINKICKEFDIKINKVLTDFIFFFNYFK
jgi:hypothetical protein